MQKATLLLALILLSFGLEAQQNLRVSLSDIKARSSKIPFRLTEVEDARENTDDIGMLKNKKKEQNLVFSFDSEKMIKAFLRKQFKSDKNGVPIKLQIEDLGINPKNPEDKNSKERFYLKTSFHSLFENQEQLLYTFAGSNDISNSKDPRKDIANYLARALRLSIENFEKAFDKHPEWKKTSSNPIGIEVQKTVRYNEVELLDTIPCTLGYALTRDNYHSPIMKDEVDYAHSAISMSYRIMAEEADKKVKLTIDPKVYFLKSKSWAKTEAPDSLWLGHQQMLFDISAAYGMKFKKSIEAENFSPGFYKTEMNALYNKVYRAYKAYIDDFQESTEFGANAEQEIIWRAKISALMDEIR